MLGVKIGSAHAGVQFVSHALQIYDGFEQLHFMLESTIDNLLIPFHILYYKDK